MSVRRDKALIYTAAGFVLLGSLLTGCRTESGSAAVAETEIRLLRTPDAGIQPQAVVEDGAVHLIYFKGEPRAGDVYYVRSRTSPVKWSEPIRVNSRPSSVIAMGSVRGAHLAVGKHGRVHVAWMGASDAEPRGPSGAAPMLYTRLNDAGTGFEPQRNVMQHADGLDGGGSVAADGRGAVYVAWHGHGEEDGEDHRRVWVARSTDEGATFSSELPASGESLGACGCCGMRAYAGRGGTLYMMYRTAAGGTDRGMRLLVDEDAAGALSFKGARVDHWELSACPMTTTSIRQAGDRVIASWENDEQIYFADISRSMHAAATAAPGAPGGRKHPVAVGNGRGETLLVWTEGTGWNKGGRLAWQVFDSAGDTTAARGVTADVPVWSFPTAFADAGGSFTIIY